MVFADRVDAGAQLATRLEPFRGRDAVVVGLPRGGVPVAAEVAKALGLPLDVIVVRKLGVPFQPELAMGAIGEGGARLLNQALIDRGRISASDVASVERRERETLNTRVSHLRRGQPRIDLRDKVAIVVDDGVATGATARVACRVARHLGADRVVLAVPVVAAQVVRELSAGPEADEVVYVSAPRSFRAVGSHYRDFTPTSDDEVGRLLNQARDRASAAAASWVGDADEDVVIPAGTSTIEGHLTVPAGAQGVVVFAHGTGSSRHSPRNRYVADQLHEAGLGTLLLDLLTTEEELDRANVFNLELLAGRLVTATRWLGGRTDTDSCRYGYFGASTGAGAALWAAAEPHADIAAVVSRGGRPDLAAARLEDVKAPTLLIVGSRDDVVIELNRKAQSLMTRAESELVLVEGATHLFEEPGTLAQAASHARNWFVRHLLSSAAYGNNAVDPHAT